jgi:hypothetical protein
MKLPHWVEKDLEQLPMDFTGTIIIECWSGGVTRRDFIAPPDRRIAPEKAESGRHVLSA